MNYLISALSYRILKLKQDRCRIILVSATGCAAAFILPLLSLHTVFNAAFKLLLAIALSLILFMGKCNAVKGMFVFCTATFIFGGFVYALGFVNNYLVYGMLLSVTACFVLYNIIKLFSVSVARQRDSGNLIYKYKISLMGSEISGNGFMDTGNKLYDSRSGLPIIVISIKSLMPYLTDEAVCKIITGHTEKVFAGARKIKCNGIGSSSDLWLISPEKFEVYLSEDKNILYDVMVGLSFASVSNNGGYDAILHPALSEVL